MGSDAVIFKKTICRIKNLRHMKRNVFLIYSSRQIKVELASFRRLDTEIVVFLPENSNGFITSTFNGDELKEVFKGEHLLWIKILNITLEYCLVF